MTTAYVPQTTVDTMARIAAGVDPWIAYRDFLEDWTYLPESRADLMAGEPGFADEEQRRWVALLAASIVASLPPGSVRASHRLSSWLHGHAGRNRLASATASPR